MQYATAEPAAEPRPGPTETPFFGLRYRNPEQSRNNLDNLYLQLTSSSKSKRSAISGVISSYFF